MKIEVDIKGEDSLENIIQSFYAATIALLNEKVQNSLDGKLPKKIIVVPNKLVNVVT